MRDKLECVRVCTGVCVCVREREEKTGRQRLLEDLLNLRTTEIRERSPTHGRLPRSSS